MDSPLAELVARSDERLQHLFTLIESNGLEEASLGEAYLDRRGADVLSHLHGWHLLFQDWLSEEASGLDVVMPTHGYTWDDIRALNDDLFARYKDLGYAEIKELLSASHAAMFASLRALPEDGLSDHDAHPWSSEPLVTLADECAGRHYTWGIDRIEEALAAR